MSPHQTFELNFELSLLKEGSIEFKIPQRKMISPKIPNNSDSELVTNEYFSNPVPSKSEPVFYNPKQAFNRDFSILILWAWNEIFSPLNAIIEPFCGSGIRSLRYALQGPPFTELICNDLNPQAIQLSKKNFEHYPQVSSEKIFFHTLDARKLFAEIYLNNKFLTVIDIDPFGSPQPYIHEALRTLANPGLLLVTATDMPVWVGLYPDKAYRRYNIANFRIPNYSFRSFCHEIAIRAFISYIQREGLNQDMLLLPLTSLSIDHYMRIALRRTRGEGKIILHNTGFIFECSNCFQRFAIPLHELKQMDNFLCSCKSTKLNKMGPVWLGPLHNTEFLQAMHQKFLSFSKLELPTYNRLKSYLAKMIDENTIQVPHYFDLHWFSKQFHTALPSTEMVIKYLRDEGILASSTHFSGRGIKTNLQADELQKIKIFSK